MQKSVQHLENNVGELQKKKTELELKLSNPETYSQPQAFKQTEKDYAEVSAQLQKTNTEYEQQFDKLLKLEEEL